MEDSAVTFQVACRADVAAVVAMLADDVLGRGRESADLEPYLAAFDAMQDEPGNELLVGVVDGEVVCCCQVTHISGLTLGGTKRGQVEGVRVAADRRGRGLGEALFAEVERRARAAGCGLVQLTTNKARGDAHRFYERLGYVASHEGFKKPL